MNKEVQAKWVEGLRSGEYIQIAGCLHKKENLYCCLGVLCDLHSKEEGGEWNDKGHYIVNGYIGITYLPPEVRKWADISKEFERRLTVMNDWGGKFSRIADVIEDEG